MWVGGGRRPKGGGKGARWQRQGGEGIAKRPAWSLCPQAGLVRAGGDDGWAKEMAHLVMEGGERLAKGDAVADGERRRREWTLSGPRRQTDGGSTTSCIFERQRGAREEQEADEKGEYRMMMMDEGKKATMAGGQRGRGRVRGGKAKEEE